MKRVIGLCVFALLVPFALEAQTCPPPGALGNFKSQRTGNTVLLTWDRAAGIAPPDYEVVQLSGPNYCSFIGPDTFVRPGTPETVVATVTSTSATVTMPNPNTAYAFYVRVASNKCLNTEFILVFDTFTTPPSKPAAPTVVASSDRVNISFSYNDPRAFNVALGRFDSQGTATIVGFRVSCTPDPKTFVDQVPPGAYTYSVVTGNASGFVESDRVAVNVGNLAVTEFTATPATIRAGQAATLSFITTGASSVFIDNGLGSQRTAGTVTVTPSQTTTYTLTASSGNSTVTSSVTVVVITQPSVSISSFPEALIQATGVAGAKSAYSVTNNGGGSTTVTVGQNGSFFTQSPTTFTLAPGATQTVTLTTTAQPPNTYDGFVTLSGNGVPAGLQVPVRLLVAAPPAAPVTSKAVDNRVDVSAPAGTNPSGSARFSNTGAGILTGTVVSDQPWLIPQLKVVTIPPGGTVSVPFTIDRSQRPDSDALLGSRTGNLSLYYISNTAAGKGRVAPDQASGGATVTVSKASVVDTVPPSSTTGAPPALASGEVALFVAGLGHVSGTVGLFISDLSVLNPLSNRAIDDLKLYYTPTTAGSLSESKTTSVNLASSRALTIGDAVKTAFGQETLGTLQIRSRDAVRLNVNATVFNSSNPAGTFGTAIPTIRSDRASSASSENVTITGLRRDSSSHTNLYIQEVSGNAITVRTEFIAVDGSTVSTRSDDLGPFGLKTLGSIVPDRAVSAILTTSTPNARFQAFATPVDDASGDTWTVADWSSLNGYSVSAPTVIPVAGVLAGAGNTFFRTDAAIMNRGGATQASGTLSYTSRTGETLVRTVTLGPRQAMIINDIIGTFFGAASGSVGYILVTPTVGAFAVTSRTYTTVAGQAATFGTGVPTLSVASALKRGSTRAIAALEDAELETIQALRPGTFRTNYGLLEVSGAAAKVRVTVKFTFPSGPKTTGVGSASKDYDLSANQFLLINGLTNDVLGAPRSSLGDLRNVEADFQVIDGEGSVMVFTSSVDNGTGDTILRVD